jgi:hypothetical protein
MNLSKNSRKLMLFFSQNKNILLNDKKQTHKTIQYLSELYNEILDSNNYTKKNINYTMSVKKIQSSLQITKPKNFNSKSFPEMVRKHIDETMMSEIVYSFSLNDRKIKLYFIVENDNIELEIDKYNRYVEIVSTWIYMLNLYSPKECVDTLTIYFYFTSLKKNLPNSNIHILNETHVNTAFTTTCPKDSEIVIFREEEWFKVFIHETFHNFGLDFSMMNNDLVNTCILDIYSVKSDVNAYEAYAEFWAEIMNALFCSFYAMKDKNNINEFLSNSEFYINFERSYSIFQLVKTLDFMGLQYRDLYSKTKHSTILRHNLYKENTNVLSYYIIKSVLLMNYQGFMGWCKTNNLSLLNFKKTTGNQRSFCEFIEKNYKTNHLLDSIHETQHFLSKLKKKKIHNKFLLTNLRMSICELG